MRTSTADIRRRTSRTPYIADGVYYPAPPSLLDYAVLILLSFVAGVAFACGVAMWLSTPCPPCDHDQVATSLELLDTGYPVTHN